jgi:hypothetical protein
LVLAFGVTLSAPAGSEYYLAMQVATGKIIDGKVVIDGVVLPEGTVVTIFAKDADAVVRLSPALQSELEEALDEADREVGVSAEKLLERLSKYG